MAMGWPELMARVVRQYVLPQDRLCKFPIQPLGVVHH